MKVNVILGEETLGQESDYFLVSGVSKIITHPDFSSSSKADNLALWKLKNPVSTETYTRICLPTEVKQKWIVYKNDPLIVAFL